MKTISILKKLKWFYVIALSIWLFVSCDVLGALGGGRLTETYSLIPTEGLTTTHIPNEDYFYVNLYEAYYVGEGFDALDSIIYSMDDGPGTDCKIPVDQESTEDLYCLMDVMEGDLWFHNIVLNYNVPAGMCDYLDFDISWHFNQRVGYGPPQVYQCSRGTCVGTGDNANLERETVYCTNPCELQDSNYLASCGGTANDLTDEQSYMVCETGGSTREDPQKFCGTLDKSENDLANCCLGSYDLYDVNDQLNHTEVKWGGNVTNCLGGLGRTNWNYFNHDGYPIGVTNATLKDGYSSTYEMPALIEKYDGHKNAALAQEPTFINANYWTDVENKDFTSSSPKFYRAPTTSQLQTQYEQRAIIATGYPYLSWTCLDKAREIRHRIHLVVREWNTQEEYNSYKETAGSRGDPDVVGAEGSICDYYDAEEASILRDTECNDFVDIDDWDAEEHGSGQNYNAYPEVIYQ